MTPFLKNNIQIYFILVNIAIFFIYFITLLIIIMSYRIKNKKLNILWPITVLKFCLPFFSSCFFGQTFLLLTTIFDCQNGYAYVSTELVCRTGLWFSIDAPLSAIGMVLLSLIALITNSLYYKSTFLKSGSDVLKKTTCYPDLSLLITKIATIILFILDDGVEDEHWAVLFFLILFTGTNTFFVFHYQNRYNKKLNFLNNVLSLMPFLGFLSLLIGKIFKNLGFNGAIFLFFSWIIFSILFILFYKKKEIEFALINYMEIQTSEEYINYIHKFYNLIINKNNSRNDYTILKSLISKAEEKCFDNQCPLKQFIESGEDELSNIFPLLQYCEQLFEYGIAKFPNSVSLKINFSLFLIMEMNHNKKALINLNTIHSSIYSFQDNYNIHKCKRLIDFYLSNKNKKVFHSFEYKRNIKDFKLLISKMTSLYHDFWTLIAINILNVTNNLDELNKIGSEIVKMNKKIDENYNSLIRVKPDNFDLIKLYSYFIENVLNNQEKYRKIKSNISNSGYSSNSSSHEIQYSNFDINTLKDKDIFKYFLLSANKKDLANIIDLSTNLCPIFGYNRNELLGKNINNLIPELFHKAHNQLLYDFNEKSKNTLFKELFKKDNYIPEYLEKQVYAISKTKFLVPIRHKVYLVQTEGNELIYIMEVIKLKDYQKDLDMNDDNNLKCVVMTDDNFFIQSFTPNCVKYLKLNDSYINANFNIINYIKQIKNDYSKKINEICKVYSLNSTLRNISFKDNPSERQANHKVTSENISYLEKKKIKKEIIEKKYLGKNEIIWRINENLKTQNEDSAFYQSLISNQESNNMNTIYYFNNNKSFYENKFIMEIKKIIINKELLGYYFIFKNKSKDISNSKNYTSYNVYTQSDFESKSVSKKKKYQYLFVNNPNNLNSSNKNQNKLLEKDEKIDIKDEILSPKKMIKFKSYDKIEFYNCKNIMNDVSALAPKQRTNSSKAAKYKTDLNNLENNDFTTINDDFIPKSSFNFAFDLANKYYKPLLEENKEKEKVLNEMLKFQALKKVNNSQVNNKSEESKTQTENDYESNESEESENEDKESSSISESNSNENSSKSHIKRFQSMNIRKIQNNDNIRKTISKNGYDSDHRKTGQAQNKNDIYNSFYKVNLSKVHFLIYDYNKDMIVDSNAEKVSKIENILKNAKSRLSVELKNSDGYPNIIFNNTKDDKKDDPSSKNSNAEKISDEKMVENKILEAINKEQEEDDIINIYKYSFIGVIILLACAGIYLYFQVNSYLNYRKNLIIIRNILSIKYCNKIGLYFIREITLLNVPDTGIKGGQYLLIPATDRTEYINLVKQKILELFMESQKSMVEFIGSQFSLSKDSDIFLSETKLITKLTSSGDISSTIKNNVVITIVQLNSAFYNIASSTSAVQQNHADLYNYVYNSLNNFGLAIDILINTYKDELDIVINHSIIIAQIQLVAYIIVFIIIYIIGLILYSKVVQRKKSYMYVFFNINFDFISSAINKCEKFINKFKLSEDNKTQEEDIDYISEEKLSLLQSDNHFKEPKINIKGNSYRGQNNNNKRKENECANNIIFKLVFGLFLLIMYTMYFVLGFYYLYNISNSGRNIAKFYYHLQHYHLNIIEYFNIFREYLFDNCSIIENDLPFNKLIEKEKNIFGNWTEDINSINYFQRTLIDVNENIASQLDRTLCSYQFTDYFKDENHCIKTLGNSYDQDINTFACGFIDELRIKKNLVRLLLNLGLIMGNLTEYETEKWYDEYYDVFKDEIDENIQTKKRFRLELFNDDYFHSDPNVIFINVILPCLDETRKIILGKLTIIGRQFSYYFLISFYGAILIGIYIFYWIPKIRELNRIIYETKNMLKIIPMHILMSDNNIINLLQVSLKK